MLKKVLQVFTKEYQEDILYRECLKKNISNFKLNNYSEDVEKKVERLAKSNLISDCTIRVGCL